VYSIDTGQRVAGEVRLGFWTMDGTELSEPVRVPYGRDGGREGYSFIPDTPLADGWYVAALDLREWRASGHVVGVAGVVGDDVAYMRVHIGPAPVWFETASSRWIRWHAAGLH
jgi:hypothetical protein